LVRCDGVLDYVLFGRGGKGFVDFVRVDKGSFEQVEGYWVGGEELCVGVVFLEELEDWFDFWVYFVADHDFRGNVVGADEGEDEMFDLVISLGFGLARDVE